MKLLKVLIYEPYLFKIYGNTRYLVSIFKHINRRKFLPILVAPFYDEFLDNIRDFGGKCFVLPGPAILNRYGGSITGDGIVGKMFTVVGLVRYTISLSSFIVKENIDVVQCHSIRSLLTIGMATKVTRTPCLFYIKGDLNNSILDRVSFAIADMVLFQCETTKSKKYPKLVQQYDRKIRILGNGIDLDDVISAEHSAKGRLREELCIVEGNLNIICIAQIYPLKGIEYLLKAMAKVCLKITKVVLYLVGDHALEEYKGYKEKLISIIKSAGLDAVVVFTGWRADALEILSIMDIFVLPSLSEGVPKSVIEAMALGKPVVTTRVGGIPELVRHGETGFIVEPRDSNGLAHAILKLANDRELRTTFGEKARSIAFREYSIKKNITGLEKIYTELARNNSEI
jgi:glycosyltransferase involved in cell wall biosynthesis